MKKNIFIALASFLLVLGTVSCNNDDTNNNYSSINNESSISINEDGSVNSWDALENNLSAALTYKSTSYSIPSFEADKYYVQNSTYYGTNMCIINCFDGFEGSVAEISYSRKLREDGYTITDLKDEEEECIYGQKIVVDDEVAIVIQFSYIEETKQFQKYCYFAIITYLYVNEKNPTYESWPSNEIEPFLLHEIPAYNDASSYELSFTTTIDSISCVDIYCYGAQDDAEAVYYTLLENAGYQISNYSSVYFATHEQNKIEIMFYMSYDNVFFIRAYSTK